MVAGYSNVKILIVEIGLDTRTCSIPIFVKKSSKHEGHWSTDFVEFLGNVCKDLITRDNCIVLERLNKIRTRAVGCVFRTNSSRALVFHNNRTDMLIGQENGERPLNGNDETTPNKGQ